jgi:hypothetical protein
MSDAGVATLKQRLDNILSGLSSLDSVEMAAIVSRQGLLIAGDHTHQPTIDTLAALTATLHMSAESTTKRLSNEVPHTIVVETQNKYFITCSAGENALVVALTANDQYLGKIIPEIKKTADQIKQLV